MTRVAHTRRGFLKVAALAGGGLAVGFTLEGCAHTSKSGAARELIPNAWLRIYPDDRVVFVLDRVEMGQGTMTSHAMLVAEELEVDPTTIEVELAPADPRYTNPMFRVQATGGSTSTKASWRQLRQAGATTRELLKRAAAAQWRVPHQRLVVERGVVVDGVTGNRARYGALTARAARMSLPHHVALKEPVDYRVIGTSPRRLDAVDKVTGRAVYGIDVKVPGLLTAVVVRPPFLGGKVAAFDAAKAEALRGVKGIVEIERGVAVVAADYWTARKAAALVDVQWDESGRVPVSTHALRERFAAVAEEEGARVRDHGDVDGQRKQAVRTLRAVYEVPYLQHATMEPMNCTAHVRADRCDVWAPTQSPGIAHEVATRRSGLSHEQVHVHQTLLGGGFGRRSMSDFVEEAVDVSRRMSAPVKVVWSREDDMGSGFLRPATYSVVEAALDDDGQPLTWSHRLAGQSVLGSVAKKLVGAMPPEWWPYVVKDYVGQKSGSLLRDGVITDPTALEGAADMPYAIGGVRVSFHQHEPGVPVGFWRSVGHSANAFVVEGFVDELASAAGEDPYRFRRRLLEGKPRHLAVLDRVAEASSWGRAPPGRHRGIAQHASFGSFCAMVVEASVEGSDIRVHKVWCAADCGRIIHPDIAAMQLESGVVFGLSAALKQAITHDNGAIEQSNFHDFPMLRMHESPVVETLLIDSDEDPTGIGEIAVPLVAPALANALFSATGRRLRRLPLAPGLLPREGQGKLAALLDDLVETREAP